MLEIGAPVGPSSRAFCWTLFDEKAAPPPRLALYKLIKSKALAESPSKAFKCSAAASLDSVDV